MGIPSSKLRQCAAVGGAILLSIAVLILAYEIYLRSRGFMASLPPSYPCVMPHLTLNHVFRANCRGLADPASLRVPQEKIWTTNSEGWRMPELENKKSILLMGDSYVEGFGLANSETLPAQLQRHLPGWQIINAGVMGFANAIYPVLWEEKFSRKKAIKYVLVNLDFSDFNENLYYTSIAQESNQSQRSHNAPVAILDALIFPATEQWPRWTMPFVYSNYSAVFTPLTPRK